MTFPFDVVYDATMQLLPAKMVSRESKALLLTIGMQESRFIHRRQVGGPARGFWQFEQGGGVYGVLNHPATKPIIRGVLEQLQYDYLTETSYEAIADNDILACAYARLLLYTVPERLPGANQQAEGWRQYLSAWRPGKPQPLTWEPFYQQAWA